MTTAIISQEERVSLCEAFTKTFGKNALEGRRFAFAKEQASEDGTQLQAWFKANVFEQVLNDLAKKRAYRAPKQKEMEDCAMRMLERLKKNVPDGWVAVVRGWEEGHAPSSMYQNDWFIVLVKVVTPAPVNA